MTAYLIIEARITDPARFATYAARAPAVMTHYGGRYTVLGGAQELLEGMPDEHRAVVSEWADRAAALAFWHSPEYTALRQLREGTGEFRVRLVDGQPS